MKEKKSGKYGLLSNIVFIFLEMFRYEKSTRVTFPLLVVIELFDTAMVVSIPAIVVALIESGAGAEEFFRKTGLLILVFAAVQITRIFAQNFYSASGTVVRVYDFMGILMRKSMSMDFCNRESNQNQKLFGSANSALNGNWVGIEAVMKRVPYVIICFFGMLLFGGAILTVDIRILIVLLAMLVCNLFTNRYARSYLNSHLDEDSEIYRKNYYLQGRISEINCGKDIRIYRMEQWFGKVLASYVEMGQDWQKRIEKHFYLPVASDTIFIALRDGLAYLLLIRQALRGEISLAEFTLMVGAVSNFSAQMFAFVNTGTELLNANKLVSHFREMLDMEDSFLHGTGKRVTEEELQSAPRIEFRDVSFRYGNEEKEILSHISLTIQPGERIALVGGNGAGKTTLVKLLCGFYHPTEGEILVNGVSIEEYDIEEYFKLVGAVFQDIDPVEMSLVNIVTGVEKENADMSRFWNAVKEAGLYEKIQSLADKEDTYIKPILHESGIQLSGGENQKLMMARCIYKDAPFLILDEPTSALDPLAESEVYESYDQMAEKKTSVFISHRLASTRFCDKILFLENGSIIEEGTHEELMEFGGRYAHIYGVQSHYYKADGEMEDAYEVE